VNQDVTPQGTPVTLGDLTVWARMLSDGSAAVALYNQEDAPATLAVTFASLGWPAGTSAAVRDLWAHSDAGVFTDRYPTTGGITVAPHETHLVRITKQ
jgi:alpha-galactosidase